MKIKNITKIQPAILIFLGIVVLISGCINNEPQQKLAITPAVDIEAGVESLLTREDNIAHKNVLENERAILRINKIDRSLDQRKIIPLSTGTLVEATFKYGIGPTKLVWDLQEDASYGDTSNEYVKSPSLEIKIEDKGEYTLYHLPGSNKPPEMFLPGIAIGDKLSFRIWASDISLPNCS